MDFQHSKSGREGRWQLGLTSSQIGVHTMYTHTTAEYTLAPHSCQSAATLFSMKPHPQTHPPEKCENFTWSAFIWSLQVSFVCPTAPGAGTCCGKRAAPTAPLQLRWSGRAVKWQRLRAVHLKLLDLLRLKATKSSLVHRSNS